MAGSQIAKPMSVKEIAERADFEFVPLPIKYWFRTADTLLKEAYIYLHEDNDQQAYLLLLRYATLVAERLPSHPEAGEPEARTSMKAARKNLPGVIGTLEKLRPRIDARYATWENALQKRREASIASESDKYTLQAQLAATDPAVAGNTTTLAAAENSELALKLAQKEYRRRDAKRRGLSEQEEQERRTAGIWDDWEAALSKDKATEEEEMRRNMEASRRRLDGAQDADGKEVSRSSYKARPAAVVETRNGNAYHYPSISQSQPLTYEDDRSRPVPRPVSRGSDVRPPKPPKDFYQPDTAVPPPRPEKAPMPRTPETPTAKLPPTFTFRPSAYLENGDPLRTVFLPHGLRKEFLKKAEKNTYNNLETCGMLCGTLISNALFISQVVIPDQKSTSDTCETTDDAAFFEYCEKEDLLQLGWIHTHPTQSCFMSSVDVHTHCAYQMMMKESIAIVCAPSKQPSWGCFRLTDPPGKQAIAQCRKQGLFHLHDESNIYTDAMKPGHVIEATGMEFRVVDLRTKK